MFDASRRQREFSAAEAAERLGVSVQRLRALIHSGELPARRIAGRWVVPVADVERRIDMAPAYGRRFKLARAWGLFLLADGERPEWLAPDQQSKLRAWLRRRDPVQERARLKDRGSVVRLRAHSSEIGRLSAEPALMLSGVSAARAVGADVLPAADELVAYVDAKEFGRLVSEYGLIPSDEPNVHLRVLPAVWEKWPERRFAPKLAVILDLLDDADPRAQDAARQLTMQLPPSLPPA